MATFSLFLIDSHALLRSSLRVVLELGVPGLQVLEASTVEEALQVSTSAPTLALLAMDAQEESAVQQTVPLLQQRWPDAGLILLFSSETSASLGPALSYGAVSVIARTDTADKLIQIIRLMLGDAQSAATDLPATAKPAPTTTNTNTTNNTMPRLTPRQSEVLELLCQGLSNKLIARRLDLSEFTVRYHVQAVFGLLQVSSRAQATFYARGSGLAG